jgi:hypothetical protein
MGKQASKQASKEASKPIKRATPRKEQIDARTTLVYIYSSNTSTSCRHILAGSFSRYISHIHFIYVTHHINLTNHRSLYNRFNVLLTIGVLVMSYTI